MAVRAVFVNLAILYLKKLDISSLFVFLYLIQENQGTKHTFGDHRNPQDASDA